jgi:TPR repeat protein
VSGAEAPEIWFNFLKTGGTEALLDICEHNKKDICGLASLLIALADIAHAPFEALSKYKYDLGNLALRWREALYKGSSLFGEDEKKLGEELLQRAAKDGYPQAIIALNRALAIEAEWQDRQFEKALEYTEAILAIEEISETLKEEMLHRRERLLKKTRRGRI